VRLLFTRDGFCSGLFGSVFQLVRSRVGLQGNERRSHQLALKAVPGRNGFSDTRRGCGTNFGVGELVDLGIVRLARDGDERDEADAPRHVAAGV